MTAGRTVHLRALPAAFLQGDSRRSSFHGKPKLLLPPRVPRFPTLLSWGAERKFPAPLQDPLLWVPTSVQTRFIVKEPKVVIMCVP